MTKKITARFRILAALLPAACCLLHSPNARAQAPVGTQFTYQGLLNVGATPANGNYDFAFALYTNGVSTNTGKISATLGRLNVGVTNGAFTVSLDFGVVFYGNATWMAIWARTNGAAAYTPLSPLQPLTPTPYAIYSPSAGSAASASSVSAANIVGIIPQALLPASVVTNGASGVNLSGAFSGSVTAAALQVTPFTVSSVTNWSTNGVYRITVPAGMTTMLVKVWGAGGGGGSLLGGGAGAYSQVSINVTPGDTYVAVVGQGGAIYNGTNPSVPGGGTGANDGSGGNGLNEGSNFYNGAGGQASSLFHFTGSAYIMKAVAGGGGGGTALGQPGGAGQSGGTGAGYAAAATTTGVANLNLASGDGQNATGPEQGGGGGGYGGGTSGNPATGGGSYGDITYSGYQGMPGNTTDTNYVPGAGAGGADGGLGTATVPGGSDGLVVVIFGAGGVNGNFTANGAVTANAGLAVNGALTATTVSGNGSGLTNLNAGNLTGTLPVISGVNLTGVAVLNASQTFSGQNTFSAAAILNGGITGPGNFTVTTGGQVGIGTNAPAYPLVVAASAVGVSSGSSVDPSIFLRLNNSSKDGSGSIPDEVGIGFGRTGTRQAIMGGTFGSDFLDFYTSGNLTAPKMRITAAGSLGIGTTSPFDMLDVVGDYVRVGALSTNGDFAFFVTDNTQARWWTGINPVDGNGTWELFEDSNPSGARITATTNGNIGIGTITPGAKLQVAGSGFFGGDSGFLSAGSGPGIRVFLDNTTGSGSIFAYNYTTDVATNLILQAPGGNVGIGTTTPGYKLQVNGTVAGLGAYNNVSDARFKTNITQLTHALDKVMALRGVEFDWRSNAYPQMNFDAGRQLGFIAQEIKEVLPEVASQGADGYYSIAYSKVIPVLTEAIKEQQKEIEQKTSDIEALKERAGQVDALQKRVDELEAAVKALAEKQ